MSVTLPSTGKTKEIFNITATAAGSSICPVVVENDAISLTCFVVSMGSGDTLDIIVEETGNSGLNNKIIHRFPQADRALANPQSIVLAVGGVLKFTAEYTGEVTFELRGRAVSGASVSATQPVEIVTTQKDDKFRAAMLCELNKINNSLEVLINHHRVITGIETERGDTF